MAAARRSVRIFYRRPPHSPHVFEQALVHDAPEVKITLAVDLEIEAPKTIEGRTAMEPGSSIVWFTFPGAWHDIGRCYLTDGSFAGIYANILTPVTIEPDDVWRTTDLCLDLWLPPDNRATLLDEAELSEAVDAGVIPPEWAARAREEARTLMEGSSSGVWPPQVVREWDLERALAALTHS